MSANISHLNGDRSGILRRKSPNEPLERFTEAKKAMGEIYKDLDEFINDLYNAYQNLRESVKIGEEKVAEVQQSRDSIKVIKDMFSRDKMKVVFFGRTSNGKSTVINAMLHSKVLPQGMGHTTCCFLQVEGGSENEKHFKVENSEEKIPIEDLDDVGHALSTGNSKLKAMGQDSLLRIFYPKAGSKLLQNDVVIVDSPGVDLSPEFDGWIDKHCVDADVFVLVCNAESTLTQAEKSFFHRVSRKLSRPNVFILNNRWDASASEPEKQREMVRGQHRTRFVQFLVDELKTCTKDEVDNRYFFISAKEVLESRLKAKGELEHSYQQEGFQRRAMEFNEFENSFEQIISKSAIKTKFENHDRRAREMIQGLAHNIDTVKTAAVHERQNLALKAELKKKEFLKCRESFAVFEKKYYEQQQNIRAEVHLKVSADFSEEITRLESIIDRFNDRFVDNPDQIQVYKDKLAAFVEREVKTNLEDKCSGGLMSRIWTLENDLHKHVSEILGQEYAPKLNDMWRYRQPFKFRIVLDCQTLLSDFQEDLEFHFSLGPEAIIRRAVAFFSGKPITALGKDYLTGGTPQVHPRAKNATDHQSLNDQFMVDVIRSSASYLANGSIGIVLVSTLIYKSVGWKVIGSGVAVYGGLYAVERLRWNSAAKEQHLKDQVRAHLSAGMKQMGGIHTTQCENQVSQELNEVHHGLKITVGGVHKEMKDSCDAITNRIGIVDEVVKQLSSLKGKTNFLLSSIDAFATKFLATE
ncbi:unnamed protein product [Bursaphelenchus okinawaensis]|uniref:Dynamin-type G domain-containing protein n=1 Tax=Bursaphelenchus okinawaensis TaxID=465554 RepID=A0A811K8B7_9BILA|nr:unnamed protein product [Bursaphelenchus okinawaensis]CAG9093785.1 unnamed protein product [Bursaphelenchus okinawaensis]